MNESKINIIKYNKISSIFFVEIAEILNNEEIRNNKNEKFLITLVDIKINNNINSIKAYINIYPFPNNDIIKYICSKSKFYKKLLSKRLRYRIKKIPNLYFIINR